MSDTSDNWKTQLTNGTYCRNYDAHLVTAFRYVHWLLAPHWFCERNDWSASFTDICISSRVSGVGISHEVVQPGDWLLCDNDGKLYTLKHEKFTQKYTLLALKK